MGQNYDIMVIRLSIMVYSNDGWGNDNVVINSNYCDGIVYLTKCK